MNSNNFLFDTAIAGNIQDHLTNDSVHLDTLRQAKAYFHDYLLTVQIMGVRLDNNTATIIDDSVKEINSLIFTKNVDLNWEFSNLQLINIKIIQKNMNATRIGNFSLLKPIRRRL